MSQFKPILPNTPAGRSSLQERLRAWISGITWKQGLRWLGLGTAGIAALFVLLFLLTWLGAFGPLPSVRDLASIRHHTATEIYASGGELIGRYYFQNRTEVEHSQIAPHVFDALVATEDARFLQHAGIDFQSLLRVFFKSILLRDESAGGGSTISQQLAKNLYERERYWLFGIVINKFREMIVARRLEQTYTKDELLTLYLNTVSFGENIYGIGVATQQFFSTTPAKIRLEHAAVLIGMLKANTTYNPRRYPERALERRNVVLEQMVKYGYLLQQDADSLRQRDLGLKYNNVSDAESLAPYFRQALSVQAKEALAELKKPDGSAWNLYTDGLKIHTTLDATMQRLAEESMETHMKELQKLFDEHWKKRKLWEQDEPGIRRAMEQSDRYKSLKAQGKTEEEIAAIFATPVPMRIFTWAGIEEREMRPIDSIIHHLSLLQAGLLAMDPQNGHIRAWVGGINHRFFKYDHVTARRQVGSTFKPFVYAAALSEGVNPCEYIPNQQVTYEGWRNWSPENADGHYEGYYTLTGGLVNSVNTVSAALIMRIGVEKAHQFASGFGFTSPLPKDPTLVLGTADLTLLEMVSAYTAFANSGQRARPVMITRIEDSQGKVLVKFPVKPAQTEAMPASTATLMAQMLRSVVDSGTAGRLRRVYGVSGQWAGKTGTTQNQTDGWFIAFNPRLVVGAWVGGEERKVRFRSLSLGQGASTALPIAGRLLHRMSQYSAYKPMFTAQFESAGPEWASQLDCPMFLPYDPAAQPDTLGGGGLQSLIDLLRARQEEKRRQRELEQENQPDVDFRYEYSDPQAPAQQEQPAPKWQKLFKRKNRDDGGGQ